MEFEIYFNPTIETEADIKGDTANPPTGMWMFVYKREGDDNRLEHPEGVVARSQDPEIKEWAKVLESYSSIAG